MSADLLLEIGTEDLPARYLRPLTDALAEGLGAGLQARGIAHGELTRYATPRRLAVIIAAVAERQAEQRVERFGPAVTAAFKDGAPTPAALGFARSCGVGIEALEQRDGKLYHARTEPGRPLAELLQGLFDDTLKRMDALVPKRMRWGAGEASFVRPVQWLVALYGSHVLPLTAFGLTAGRCTYGHRFHAPQALELDSPASYVERLRAARVMADPDERRAAIARQITEQARAVPGHARVTDALLDEVNALVEWPVAITGRFETRFLDLPPEVIVATVETNQRYFTVFEDEALTRLTPAFITIANLESREVAQVIRGNERVVRPRLTDALFFFDQDRALPFADYGPRLAGISYQERLGTLAARVERLTALGRWLAGALAVTPEVAQAAERAAALCKHDLVTKMVYEFPELQGIMGGYYARAAGEPEAVARAIREHYQPAQQGTPIPGSPAGQLVALADKLDALAGFFAVGQKPTASKDPFGLRRAALGLLRICLEGGWGLDLRAAFKAALDLQPAGDRGEATLGSLLDFALERLRAYRVGAVVEGRAIGAETFEAVRVLGLTEPLSIDQRLLAAHGFLVHPAAGALAAAHKRVRNLLRQAGTTGSAVDPDRFEHTAEHALWATVRGLESRPTRDPAERLRELASLKEPVDAFFEAVMVNAEDPALRQNRLALLARLDGLCRSVVDFAQLPG